MSPLTSIAPTSKLIKAEPNRPLHLSEDHRRHRRMRNSVTSCGSKCNFNCYSSTFTILSTLFSLNSFVVITMSYIYIYMRAVLPLRSVGRSNFDKGGHNSNNYVDSKSAYN